MIVASLVSVSRLDACGLHEEGANRDGVGRVVGALVDDLQHVVRPEDRGRHLDAAGSPAVRHGHLARGERDLIARNGDRLQDCAADHPLRLLVEVAEVIGSRNHSAASATFSRSRRSWRNRANSAWKST